VDVSPRARLRRTAVGLLRLLVVLTDPQLNLEATALVYRTLLSIVPLLAVSFSVLKAFGQPQGQCARSHWLRRTVLPCCSLARKFSDYLSILLEMLRRRDDAVRDALGSVSLRALATSASASDAWRSLLSGRERAA